MIHRAAVGCKPMLARSVLVVGSARHAHDVADITARPIFAKTKLSQVGRGCLVSLGNRVQALQNGREVAARLSVEELLQVCDRYAVG